MDGWHPALKERARHREWLTKDQGVISYSEMDDHHLLNTLLFLRGMALEKAQEEAAGLGIVLRASGWVVNPHPQFESLLEEARQRGGSIARAAEEVASLKEIDPRQVRRMLGRRPP